jgi:restriction system protein
MSRRSRQNIFDDLLELPWWVSVVVAAIVYLSLRFALPAFLSGNTITAALGNASQQHAWLFGLLFLLPALVAAYRQYRRR